MLERNTFLFKIYHFFWRFKPLEVLMIVYFYHVTQSYTFAAAVFAIFNICYALAKIPCGLISDKIGRRPVLIISNFFLTAAFFCLALSGQFEIKYLLYLFSVFWALSEAMAVDTVDALIYETSQSLGQSDKFYLIYSKSMFFSQAGCAFGSFWAMIVTYFFPLQFVAWLSVFPPAMQLIISYFFVEPNIKKEQTSLSLKDIMSALKQFKYNKNLLFYAITDIYFSALGDISHRLESAYFKLFASDWIISFARTLKHLCGMAGCVFVTHLRRFSKAHIYFGAIISNVFVRTLALILNNICTPFIHAFINFFYTTALTTQTEIMQEKYLPQYRATAQSIIQFVKGIYMALLMFLLGIFADFYNIYFAMILLVFFRITGLAVVYIFRKYA